MDNILILNSERNDVELEFDGFTIMCDLCDKKKTAEKSEYLCNNVFERMNFDFFF